MTWPTSPASNADLLVATNNVSTTLSAGITLSDTTLNVDAGAVMPSSNFAISIESEIIFVGSRTGNTLSSLVRGYDSTTAASHAAGEAVEMRYVSHHHNSIKDEIVAIESSLDFTVNRALISNASGRAAVSSVTSTELGYVSGVTSSIQTQINSLSSGFILKTGDTMSGALGIVLGTVTAPGLFFSGDTNTGIYSTGADVVSVTTGGSAILTLAGDATVNKGVLLVQDGAVGSPSLSFAADTNTGIYRSTTDTVVVSTGGTAALTLSGDTTVNKGQLKLPDGSVSAPGMSFNSDPDSGVYSSAADGVSLSAGGVEGLQVLTTAGVAKVLIAATASPSIAFSGATTTGFARSGTSINIIQSGSANYTFASNGLSGNWSGLAVTAPSIRSLTDTNTGVNFTGADNLELVAGGSARLGVTTTQVQAFVDLNTQSTQTAKITAVSADTTLGNHYFVTVDASGGSRTISLPALSGITGRIYEVKKIDSSANAVVLDGNASEAIDGAPNISITGQYNTARIVAGATEWHVF